EQAEHEFIPDGWTGGGFDGGDAAVSKGIPAGFAGFIAGGPRLWLGVIRVRIAQLQAGAAAISRFGPASAVEIADLAHRICLGIFQYDPVRLMAEMPGKIP